ncbi:proline dehydrogenase family protein [Candidatus Micrarchaeota archaeon]|nr:proline dehydrogenase family protein [Candidatus Micrarchaeota archaeon]
MIWKKIIKSINYLGYPIFAGWSAGRTEEDALNYAVKANSLGLKVSLNYLGEKQTDEKLVQKVLAEYLKLIRKASESRANADITVKLSQLGLEIPENGKQICETNVRKIVEEAKRTGLLVWIDMEYSHYVDYTLGLYQKLNDEFGNVCVALQANLKRTESDLQTLSKKGKPCVRLVKGIYPPPPNEGYTEKKDIDDSFRRLIEFGLSNQVRVAVATHDENFISFAEQLAKQNSTEVEIQMLKGVRPHLQQAIMKRNANFNIYAPYGHNIFAYGVRRAREAKRTSFTSNLIDLSFGWIYNKVH